MRIKWYEQQMAQLEGKYQQKMDRQETKWYNRYRQQANELREQSVELANVKVECSPLSFLPS